MLYRLSVSKCLMGIRFFTCNQRLLSTVMSSQAHFFSNSAPNDTDNNGPEQCSPNVPIRCGDNSKNGPTRYNTQDITTVSYKLLCSSNAAHSILTTNCTYRGVKQGGFHKFPTRKTGFCPTFQVFVSVRTYARISICTSQRGRNHI